MTDIDQATLEQAKRGDQTAFKRIYDHYAPFVWKVTYRTAGSDQDLASEIVQETFVRFYGSFKKFKGASGLGTWIYRIAYNTALTILKRRRIRATRHVSMESVDPSHLTTAPATSVHSVKHILDSLSPEERFLLVSREVTGLSFEELASIANKNEGALRTSLHRLKQRLKEEFQYEI